MAIWLKLVGAVDQPMPDPWLAGRLDLRTEVGFNTRASVDIGEELVLYAVPQRRIIGIAEVLSHPIWSGKEERWPWRSKIRLKLAIADYDRAPTLDDIEEPGGRDLSKSVQRRGQMKLRWGEYARARDALERAFEPALGDERA
jgi:hypothetical protein